MNKNKKPLITALLSVLTIVSIFSSVMAMRFKSQLDNLSFDLYTNTTLTLDRPDKSHYPSLKPNEITSDDIMHSGMVEDYLKSPRNITNVLNEIPHTYIGDMPIYLRQNVNHWLLLNQGTSEDLLDVKDTAEVLNISMGDLNNMILDAEMNDIPFVKKGYKYYFVKGRISRWWRNYSDKE